MKAFLKKIIPVSILNKRHKNFVVKRLSQFFKYDEDLFFKHSSIWKKDVQSKQIGVIVLLYHVIEKGLTMPNMKLGFGKEKLIQLIDECNSYHLKYDISNTQFIHALGVIQEYKYVHSQNNFELEAGLDLKIDSLLNKTSTIPQVEQISENKNNYFSQIYSSFDLFSQSRKSIRSFEGTVEMAKIYEAIALAQNTPSTCNRQPVRVHVVENKEKIQQVLEIQKGNRGFGHLVDKAIVVTADLSIYQSAEERYTSYVDGGMHAMNLLYALHYHKIAACPLNWSKSPEEDLKLRATIKIPDSEVIILVIACGSVPEDFKIAASVRNNYKDITTTH
ncbi:nitroreductase family protein [Flavobacterium sp.]|uniref:nitroreductase family protein n=1 Tax=Flavobacterium sp. TaxID=239 RepID=UPI002B9B9B28|nr:nitroreductase family protein [Flavobacterium sp.]HQA75252.1 nitroreductase family protein [Flavobacterium sp.]